MILSCAVSRERARVQWFRNGVKLKPGPKYKTSVSGFLRRLTINDVTREVDEGSIFSCRILDNRELTETSTEIRITIISMSRKRRHDKPHMHDHDHLFLLPCCFRFQIMMSSLNQSTVYSRKELILSICTELILLLSLHCICHACDHQQSLHELTRRVREVYFAQ